MWTPLHAWVDVANELYALMSSPIYPLPSAHFFHKNCFPIRPVPLMIGYCMLCFAFSTWEKEKRLVPSNTYDRYSNLRCPSSNDMTLVGDGSLPGLICILPSVAMRRVSFSGWRFPLVSSGKHQSLCSTEIYCSMFGRRAILTGDTGLRCQVSKN